MFTDLLPHHAVPASPVAAPASRPTPTRAMVHQRTRELALLAGRGPLGMSHADYVRARLELTGEAEFERQDELLDSHPASPCPTVGSKAFPLKGSAVRRNGRGR